MEPPPGADPGRPPYEGGAAAVRGGQAAGQGLEPRLAASGAAVLPLDDPALRAGGEGRTPRRPVSQNLGHLRPPREFRHPDPSVKSGVLCL
jgi:hypothetical protein